MPEFEPCDLRPAISGRGVARLPSPDVTALAQAARRPDVLTGQAAFGSWRTTSPASQPADQAGGPAAAVRDQFREQRTGPGRAAGRRHSSTVPAGFKVDDGRSGASSSRASSAPRRTATSSSPTARRNTIHVLRLRGRPARPTRKYASSPTASTSPMASPSIRSGPNPRMGLRRQHRQRRALPLQERRPEGVRQGRDDRRRAADRAITGRATSRSRPTARRIYLSVGSGSNIGEDVNGPACGRHRRLRRQTMPLGAHVGRGAGPRRRARVRSRRAEPAGLRHRHPQLLRHDHPARDRRPVVRRQRARRARRQPAARLRHARGGGRLLRLALVLHRQPRGPARAAEGPAPRPRRQGDGARRAVPGRTRRR